MDLRLFVLLVINVATWSGVLGQSAFDTSSCDDLTALSGVGTVVGGNAPFSLASSPTTYSPGGAPVQVFLFSRVGGQTQFSSVILQARRVDNGAVVGSFDISNNPELEFLACGDLGMATVITSERTAKNLPLITMWIPPLVSYGNLQFVATVVDEASNIYERILSLSEITATVPLVPLTITACPTQPTITNSVVTYPTPTCQRGNTPFGDAVCDRPSGSTFEAGVNTVNCNCADAGDTAPCTFTVVVPAGNPCNPNPCQNGGGCNVLGGGAFFCSCINSFTGTTCEQGQDLTAQPCPPALSNFGNTYFWNPPNCLLNGNVVGVATCTPQPGGSFFGANNPVSCVCDNGGQQDICSFNINALPPTGVCMNNPCVGGAECRVAEATEAGYTCHSTVGVPCQ